MPSGTKPHPIGLEARKLHKLAQILGRGLGLSYTARSRTGAPQEPEDAEKASGSPTPRRSSSAGR